VDAQNHYACGNRYRKKKETALANGERRMIRDSAAGALSYHAIRFSFFQYLGFLTGGDFEILRARGDQNVAILERHLPDSERKGMRPHADVVGFNFNSRSIFRAKRHCAALERRSNERVFVIHPQRAGFGECKLNLAGTQAKGSLVLGFHAVAVVHRGSNGGVDGIQTRVRGLQDDAGLAVCAGSAALDNRQDKAAARMRRLMIVQKPPRESEFLVLVNQTGSALVLCAIDCYRVPHKSKWPPPERTADRWYR